jgi:PhzF family phenazine biosynthesis protein
MNVYVVNAFAENRFGGNPAAVVPLKEWLSDALMQQVAAQHNLAETAFIVSENDGFRIRWFTPAVEVDLCGHATLASAHVLFNHLGYDKEKITFQSKSGPLHVQKSTAERITLDFPADDPHEAAGIPEINEGLHTSPVAVYKSSFDYMVVLNSQAEIEKLKPDMGMLKKIAARGVLVTAKGDQADFVSRCFFPQSGIDEDPATGSAHTAMVPYWSKRLGKTKLSAIQLSPRKGYLECELVGNRVLMSGRAHTYLSGEIFI